MRIVSSSLALALTASALTVPAAFAADAPRVPLARPWRPALSPAL